MIVYRLGHQHGNHGAQRLALAIKVVACYGVQLRLRCARLQQLQYKLIYIDINTDKYIYYFVYVFIVWLRLSQISKYLRHFDKNKTIMSLDESFESICFIPCNIG